MPWLRPETASIAVFFLTGRNDKESVMQVVSLKPENYLLKTIQRDKLLAVLGDFLQKDEARCLSEFFAKG